MQKLNKYAFGHLLHENNFHFVGDKMECPVWTFLYFFLGKIFCESYGFSNLRKHSRNEEEQKIVKWNDIKLLEMKFLKFQSQLKSFFLDCSINISQSHTLL